MAERRGLSLGVALDAAYAEKAVVAQSNARVQAGRRMLVFADFSRWIIGGVIACVPLKLSWVT
jgi:hypothetical protein